MNSIKPDGILCPSCGHEIGRHPWFVHKRVREWTCPHCGAQLEVVIPAWPHYITAFALASMGELLVLVLLLFVFSARWSAVLALIAAFTGIELVRSAWLRGKSQVRWINRESMQRSAAGSWVPR
jgi:hypothetical protein